ncbi:MAG: ATP-binding protein [Bauldia sp.]|nr:ATP-binding protein [Bauldia sp.]
MSRFLPKSLFGQTLLILLAGLVVSQLIGAWIYTGAREQAVRTIGALALAQRVANLTRLVEEAPAEWQPRIVEALSDPAFRVSLSANAPVLSRADTQGSAKAIEDFMAEQLPDRPGRHIQVAVSETSGLPFAGPPFNHPMPMGPMMGGMGTWRSLEVAVELASGQWLSFATTLPNTGPPVSLQFILSLAVMAVIVLAVSVWAVRRVTAPLSLLARAAERLGKDVGAEPLAEIGTAEMRQASHAFNEMQERLGRLIENRTRMLAAISHDLRTPLTLLRLRAEAVENSDNRSKMLATIAEMDAMIAATLAFARDETTAEPRRRTDLSALLASIVDDMADAGLPVAMEPAQAVIYECQPSALKRAFTNLLDNAVKYGQRARVGVRTTPQTIEIMIDDEGPGISEDELARVFQPFYRVEGSRNRETGGIGLGLAIALVVVQAHGGRLTLSNRPQGGLRACITLPI